MYIRRWVWQMFYFCTYNTSTVKGFLPYERHFDESAFIWISRLHSHHVCTFTGMYINHLIYIIYKNRIPSTCKLYSDHIWKFYFLIPTLLSVKLKNIYIYLKVYYFIMKNIYFEKALFMCHLSWGCPVVAPDFEVTCRSVKAGWIVHYELENKYINVWN